jgi:prepilin-type processing-associated H-X9-DG protein
LRESFANSKAVLLCPVTTKDPQATGIGTADSPWRRTSMVPADDFVGGYGINNWLYDPNVGTFSGWAQWVPANAFGKDTAIQKPVETPAYMDCIRFGANPLETDPPSSDLYNGSVESPNMGRVTITRHQFRGPSAAPRNHPVANKLPGGINIGFADGHVSAVKLESLWSYYWHKRYVVPAKRPGT